MGQVFLLTKSMLRAKNCNASENKKPTTRNFKRSVSSFAFSIFVLLMLNVQQSFGATSTQNFGTTPLTYSGGTAGSATYIPNPTTGTTYARIGTGGHLQLQLQLHQIP